MMTMAQARSTYLAVACPASGTTTVIYKSLMSRPASQIDQATVDRVHAFSLTAVRQDTAEFRAFTQTDPAWPPNLHADIAKLADLARTHRDEYVVLTSASTGPQMVQIWNSWPGPSQAQLNAWQNIWLLLGLPPGFGC